MTRIVLAIVVLGWAAAAVAAAADGPATVPLPCLTPGRDPLGAQWMLHARTALQQAGQPSYSDAGTLFVNSSQADYAAGEAALGPGGEVVFDNMPGKGYVLGRRMLAARDGAWLRIIDVIRNTEDVPVMFSFWYRSVITGGCRSIQVVTDSARRERQYACIAENGRGGAVAELSGARGGRIPVVFEARAGHDNLITHIGVLLPPGRQAAIARFHVPCATKDAAAAFVANADPNRLLADVPAHIRALIVNFPANGIVGGVQVLRADAADLLELRDGRVLQGELADKSLAIETQYGPVEIPSGRLLGLIVREQPAPRHFLVSREGDVYSGILVRPAIAFTVAGKSADFALGNIRRLGLRANGADPQAWTFERPLAYTAAGDRISIAMPEAPIEFASRLGLLKLKPSQVGLLVLDGEDNEAHRLHLADGSRISGLLAADTVEIRPILAAGGLRLRLPVAALARLRLAGDSGDVPDDAPRLYLTNRDLLAGAIVGQYRLHSALAPVALGGPEVQRITALEPSAPDIEVRLADDSMVRGRLAERAYACRLRCGLEVSAPATLLAEYRNPSPMLPAAMLERVRLLVAELNADEWRQREAAERHLLSMGPGIAGALRSLRPGQPIEVQQRIDRIVAAPRPR